MQPPTEYPCPSWEEIKEGVGKYWIIPKGGTHIVHHDIWDSSLNPEFQFSLDKEVVQMLKSRSGPKSKYGRSRGVGRRKSGMAYAIRKESCQLMVQHVDWDWWKKQLEEYPDKLKPNSTKRITLHSLDLSKAMEEFIIEMRKETEIHNHPRLKKGWRTQICRLIEIRVRFHHNSKQNK
jgi:hypothetical protein